jgi:hypothetical protein
MRFLSIICLLISVSLSAQTTRHKEEHIDYYPDGKSVMRVTVTITKRNTFVDLYNYYKQTTTTVTEFSRQGNKTEQTKRITKLGNTGKPCYEIYYRQTLYDPKGRRTKYEKYECDKRLSVQKEYEEGKVVFIREHRRKKRH